jgi:hypothetical protein
MKFLIATKNIQRKIIYFNKKIKDSQLGTRAHACNHNYLRRLRSGGSQFKTSLGEYSVRVLPLKQPEQCLFCGSSGILPAKQV